MGCVVVALPLQLQSCWLLADSPVLHSLYYDVWLAPVSICMLLSSDAALRLPWHGSSRVPCLLGGGGEVPALKGCSGSSEVYVCSGSSVVQQAPQHWGLRCWAFAVLRAAVQRVCGAHWGQGCAPSSSWCAATIHISVVPRQGQLGPGGISCTWMACCCAVPVLAPCGVLGCQCPIHRGIGTCWCYCTAASSCSWCRKPWVLFFCGTVCVVVVNSWPLELTHGCPVPAMNETRSLAAG